MVFHEKRNAPESAGCKQETGAGGQCSKMTRERTAQSVRRMNGRSYEFWVLSFELKKLAGLAVILTTDGHR
jgi:hypothetical protein